MRPPDNPTDLIAALRERASEMLHEARTAPSYWTADLLTAAADQLEATFNPALLAITPERIADMARLILTAQAEVVRLYADEHHPEIV